LLNDIASVISTKWKTEDKILKFSAYYESPKFTWDQTDKLVKLE
jgi:hypothetical protein